MLLFGYIATAIVVLIVLFMPKRITWREIYITWAVMVALTLLTDLVLGEIYELYDITIKGVTFHDLVFETFLPSSFGIIVVNFMPLLESYFVAYLFIGVSIAALFEFEAVHFGLLTYKGWSIWYSVFFYFLGMIFLRWHISFIRKSH